MSGSPRSSTMQSNCLPCSWLSASAPVPTAVVSRSSPASSVVMLSRWALSSSTTSSRFTGRSTKSVRDLSDAAIESRLAGLVRKSIAPSLSPRCQFSSTDITCTGMCRVAGSCFSRSRMVHPSASGSRRSSVTAVGMYSRTSASAWSARCATIPL